VLVVQADPFNESSISTVIVVPLTKNLRLAAAPGNVALAARQTGLRRRSVANVSQVAVLDRQRFVEKVAMLPGAPLKQVEAGMRMVLGL
jgi:mRNA interferase MazF